MPSKNYIAPETANVWGESGGSGVTKLLDMGGLAASTGIACGAYLDLGSGSRSDLYEVELTIDGFGGSITVGTTVDLYFIQSNDSTSFDGAPTTAPTTSAEGTITANQARNGYYAGSVFATDTASGQILRAKFVCRFTGRYIAPVVANRTSQALNNSGDDHRVIVTPIPYESQ